MPPTAAEETAICGDSLAPYYSVDSDLLITTKTIFIRSGGFRLSITDKKTKDILLGYQLWSLGQGLKFVSDSTLNLMKQAIKIHTNKSISVSSDEEVNKLIDYYIPSITQRYKKLLSHHFEFDRHRIPLFSIYIPVYNTEKYLEKCIASVLCQSIQDYEIVIVNDGSTDNTARILERFRDNPKIHLFQQSNGGIGSASNLAIRNSRGEYIVQLDSDDCLLPNALEEVAKFFFQKPSSHCLFTKAELINELGEVTGPAWCHGPFNIYDNLVGMTVSHLRTFRRAMYHRTTGFNEEITNAVDYDFFLQLSAQCSIDFLDKVLYQYRKHKAQTSFRQNALQKINHVKVVNMHLQRVGCFDFYAVAANPFSPRQCYILKKGSDFENKIIHTKFRHGKLTELLLPEPRAKGNDYSAMQSFVTDFYKQNIDKNYTEKVSIVVPVYNRAERLSRCLAGICKQTYPADLIEVVVADDGSSDEVLLIIDKYKKILNLKYVKQNDSGYRVSAVRNLGIRTAIYRNISIIDCDLIPLPNFIEAFMQYLHHFDNVVLLGHQKFVDPTGVSDDDILGEVNILEQLKEIKSENATLPVDPLGITKDWRYKLYVETNYLKDDQFPYRAFSSGHVAFRKKAIQDAGFYDESFNVWGGEDNECGYRLYLNGVYFIPVLDAIDLHQEPPSGKNETNRLVDREISRDLLQSKVPATRGWFGKPYVLTENDKPLISIGIPMRNTGHFVIDAIRSVLAQSIQSLEILVYDDGSSDYTLALVENTFGFNPKIIIIKGFIQKGVTHARNAIIEQCRGEFIGFVDSDDLLMPKCLEECIKVFRSNSKVGLVCTSYNTISEEGVFLSAGYVPKQFNRHTALLGNIFTHFRMFRMRDWNRSRKWTADEIGDLLYAEDWDLCLKIAEVTDFEYIIKPLYCYRIRSGSITTSTNFNFKFNQTKKMLLNWIKYLHLPFSDIVGVDDSNPHAIGYIRQD